MLKKKFEYRIIFSHSLVYQMTKLIFAWFYSLWVLCVRENLRHGCGNIRRVSASYFTIYTPKIVIYFCRFKFFKTTPYTPSCRLCLYVVLLCTHATLYLQTCEDNSIFLPYFVFLHPVFITLSMTFEVTSHQQDLR